MTHKTFKREDLKAGMVCEVEELGKRSLAMVTYNKSYKLCLSGTDMWRDLETIDADDLTYTSAFGSTVNKVIKVYSRTTNRRAHKLSTDGRELLWERKEKKSLTLEEIEELLGHPVEIVTTTPPTDEPSVDVEKMRDELLDHCHNNLCSLTGCPLEGEICRCGRGTNFKKTKPDGTYDMTDDEIIAAYKIVFPDKAVEDKPYKYNVGDRVVMLENHEGFKKGEVLTVCVGDDEMPKLTNGVTERWALERRFKPYKEV